MQVHLYESQTYVFMTRLTLGLSPETLTPNPAPRGGELFSARFFGPSPRKTALSGFPPSPGKGMGLPTPSTQDLGKAGRVSHLSSAGYLILVPKIAKAGKSLEKFLAAFAA